MSTPNFRALCAELVALDGHCVVDCTEEWADAMCRIRAALAQPKPVWTEGICGDGAAILKDGVMQPIEDVIAALNATALAQPEPVGEVATDEELEATARAAEIQYMKKHGGLNASTPDGIHAQLQAQYLAGLRAVLARWGNAIPQSVPVATPPAPAGGLVGRVGEAMERHHFIGDIEGSWDAQARAAIREVAAWMRDHEHAFNAAYWLELEGQP